MTTSSNTTEYIKQLEEQNEELRDKLSSTEAKLDSMSKPLSVDDMHNIITNCKSDMDDIAIEIIKKAMNRKEMDFDPLSLKYEIKRPDTNKTSWICELSIGSSYKNFWNRLRRQKTFHVKFVLTDYDDRMPSFDETSVMYIEREDIVDLVMNKLEVLTGNAIIKEMKFQKRRLNKALRNT